MLAPVVAEWLGRSPLVAATHYLLTRDADFKVALRGRRGWHLGRRSNHFSRCLAPQRASQATLGQVPAA